MRNLPFYFVILAALYSCTDHVKEQNLEVREQILLTKEKAFAAKEAEYQDLLALRDSLKNIESQLPVENVLPESILGTWKGKMICTESSCPEHVIGDQRSDSWEFTPDGLKMTNITGSDRLFTAKVNGTELKFTSESNSNITNTSEITLNLNDMQNGRIKGTRDFIGKNDCIARFSVDLEKTKN